MQFSAFFGDQGDEADERGMSLVNNNSGKDNKHWLGIENRDLDIVAKIDDKELKLSRNQIQSDQVKDILVKRKKSSGSRILGLVNESPRSNEKELNKVGLNVSAEFIVKGTRKRDVADLTENLSNHLGHYLKGISSVANWTGYDPHEAEKLLHHEFSRNIKNLLKTSAFKHGSSLMMLDEFSSAQDLLSDGVDKYVKEVHSVLKTDLDESIAVLVENFTYKVLSPKIGVYDGQRTVSSTLFKWIFGPCLVGARAVKNVLRQSPPIEFETRVILDKLSALIEPGKLTLVLGPPGCGKTSFLKAISGQLQNANSFTLSVNGSIKYNGREIQDLKNLAAWVSYTGQHDEHQPLLTVKDTLNYAFKCRKNAMYADGQIMALVKQFSGEEAVEKLMMLRDLEVDIALALLGLTICKDTIIGNENIKGVSGGEKRRVTLGEMLVTGSQIMCCDEISTGLDSAATFDIVAYLRSAAHVLKKSIIVALLQPPPEVINLFDNVLVLSKGNIIYHGPTKQVIPYFNELGFKMIAGKDIGDFIVEIPTRNGSDYVMNKEELEARDISIHDIPKTAESFAEAWKNSVMFENEQKRIDKKKSEYLHLSSTNYFDYDDMPERPFLEGLWDTIVWSMDLRFRDKTQIAARIVANLATGFFFGTLFWQLTLSDWWLKGMLFLMALMFIVSTAFPTVQIISQQKGIFLKHISAKFYTPLQFTLAQYLVAIPFIAFDTAVFGASLYWMCGLAPEIHAFVIFIVVCVTFGIAMNSVMQVFPFITKNEDTAIVGAALFLILSVSASTALSTESMTPAIFRWAIWINPLAWSYRALAINEYMTKGYFHSPCKFNMVGQNITIFKNCSEYFLDVREVRKDPNYVWGALVFNILISGLMLLIQTRAVKGIRFETLKKSIGVVPGESLNGNGILPPSFHLQEEALRKYLEEKYLTAVTSQLPKNRKKSRTGFSFGFNNLKLGFNGAAKGELSQPLLGESSISDFENQNDIALSMPMTDQKTLVVKNLWYTIPIDGEPIDFLKDVSFVARPYRLVGLMGSSGAGKSTLMDVISGRKTVGYSRGEIYVNGSLKNHNEFVKYAAYVEQFGIHADCATIRESLQFSAELRLSFSDYQLKHPDKKVTMADFNLMKRNLVEMILEVLELDDIANEMTGLLSMEQNKRLTLGVELVANPSIIFCDEPTSGLDARAAAIVMKVLLKTAQMGRTVVCTVHQPSTAIFNFFDDLILLKRGGEIVFSGDLGTNSNRLIKYLNGIPGTKPYSKGMNPATWMLEVIGAGTDMRISNTIDYASFYNASSLKKENEKEILMTLKEFQTTTGFVGEFNADASYKKMSSLTSPFQNFETSHIEYSIKNPSLNRYYVRSQFTQVWLLFKRNLKTYWRSPEFSLNRLVVVMLFTVVFSIFFYNSKLRTIIDLQGRIVNIFFFATLTCIYNLYTLVPFALSRRALFYRERAQKMYSVFAFSFAEGLVEIPWIFVQVVATLPFLYYLTNLSTVSPEPFLYFFTMMVLSLVLMTSLGLLAASLFPDPLAAQLSAVFVVIVLMVFCGIMVPLERLPLPYIPLYYFSFFKYIAEGLMSTQFHNINKKVCIPAGVPWKEENPTIITDTLKWLHNHVSKDFPENLCTLDGNLTLNPLELKDTLESIKNVTGIELEAEEFVLQDFMKDYNYDKRWLDLIVIVIWIYALRLLAFVVMATVNHQKR